MNFRLTSRYGSRHQLDTKTFFFLYLKQSHYFQISIIKVQKHFGATMLKEIIAQTSLNKSTYLQYLVTIPLKSF